MHIRVRRRFTTDALSAAIGSGGQADHDDGRPHAGPGNPRSGDPQATRLLVERVHGIVFGHCYRMLNHRQNAMQRIPPFKRDSSLNSTIPELPGSGWLAAEPEATPQTHSLRPWGFPTVSPSHPNVFPHHGILRITVEFSEKSRLLIAAQRT